MEQKFKIESNASIDFEIKKLEDILTKIVDGKIIPLSQDEIIEFRKREQEHEKKEEEDKKTQYKKQRQREFPLIEELIVALWEKVIEGKSDSADDLQLKRQAIKDKYPKPDLEKK